MLGLHEVNKYIEFEYLRWNFLWEIELFLDIAIKKTREMKERIIQFHVIFLLVCLLKIFCISILVGK